MAGDTVYNTLMIIHSLLPLIHYPPTPNMHNAQECTPICLMNNNKYIFSYSEYIQDVTDIDKL